MTSPAKNMNKTLDSFFKKKETKKDKEITNDRDHDKSTGNKDEINSPVPSKKKSINSQIEEKLSNDKKKKIEELEKKSPIKNKDKILSSLSPLESFDKFIEPLNTWKDILSKYLKSDKMKNTYNYVVNEYKTHTCYPPINDVFNAFAFTSWEEIRVVIIGQDPYFNVGEAMGLCFSVNKGIKIPKSLQNIYKALNKEGFKTPKTHGDLSSWAKQGVLMLNATMTVEAKKANSHQKNSGWESFTDNVLQTIDQNKEGVVFLLWGNFAIKKKKLLTSNKSYVIENIHPSPLAASKGDFSAKKQFTMVNEYLVKQGKKPIDWNISD